MTDPECWYVVEKLRRQDIQ